MGIRRHYLEETKWKEIEMKQAGYTNCEMMETLGIKIWMRWYKNSETHRFS
jgi:transposase